MKERAKELKAEPRAAKGRAAGERDVLAKIAELPEPDRFLAGRLHEIITASAPDLSPKTWYGMPAYANKDGKVICFLTPAAKFKGRYASFGFNADAHLDEGTMWPTAWADGHASCRGRPNLRLAGRFVLDCGRRARGVARQRHGAAAIRCRLLR